MTIVTHLDTRRLDQIIANEPNKASEIVRTTAFEVEQKAKMLAPVDTGALKGSLKAEEHTGPLSWWVHDGMEYGYWQELGTSRMAAHPFMVPAVENVRAKWVERWRELFSR
jgi:HK97 gp10 family phage protein